MPEGRPPRPRVAIVDYGMGNLFSVERACEHAGMEPIVTASREALLASDGVILPGVGAFSDAMQALSARDLVAGLREVAAVGKPLIGICLGMQLLMSESHEFGRHQGLGIIPGDVVRLSGGVDAGRRLKVPQVGWNRISPAGPQGWRGSYLESLPDGAFMYFVHSFYVRPAEPGIAIAVTPYGSNLFCAALQRGTVFGCQFHPERSATHGMQLYRTIAEQITRRTTEVTHV